MWHVPIFLTKPSPLVYLTLNNHTYNLLCNSDNGMCWVPSKNGTFNNSINKTRSKEDFDNIYKVFVDVTSDIMASLL